MRKRFIALMMVLLALCAGMMGCDSDREVRETEEEATAIRIYDVEPQVREDFTCVQHYTRVGVLNDISDVSNPNAPFFNQINKIKEESGADIEYLIFDNWEDLLAAEKEFEDVRVTEMILFNNTFNGSIVKEVSSGRYADMEPALKEYGFYEEKAYNQIVLDAGVIGNQHVLVPILYNVSGMIEGESEPYSYEEWKKIAYAHVENESVNFEELIDVLTKEMTQANVEEMALPFMSPGFLEGKVDLFLMAAGIELDTYERQEDLFTILYNYLNTYQETQVEISEELISNQSIYAKYLDLYMETAPFDDYSGMSVLSDQAIKDLKLKEYALEGYDQPTLTLVTSMLERVGYVVECSTSEKVAFHSVFGLLENQEYLGRYFTNGKLGKDFAITKIHNMSYWPIGVSGSHNAFAAQPICYAAVVEGGSTRLAAKVIQAMLNQPTDFKYGISPCNATLEQQFVNWEIGGTTVGNVRVIAEKKLDAGPDQVLQISLEETIKQAYWGALFGSTDSFMESTEIYAAQVRNQIDNIVSAEIPDREILTIWQDTLTESVEQELSPQAGFELLCKRMEAWYE